MRASIDFQRKNVRRYISYVSFGVETFVLHRCRPYFFILVLNDKCNLNCFYCESKNTGQYDLDWGTVQRHLKSAYKRGNRALLITGGEPMLWTYGKVNIGDVIVHAREIGFLDIAIFTNGTFPLSIPDCTYIVTIDGTEKTHNAIRLGTYRPIIENVKKAKGKVHASITVSKTNKAELEAAVTSIAEKGVFSRISFNLLTHHPEIVARHGLTGEEREAVLDLMWGMKQQGFPIILSRDGYTALRKNNWSRPVKQIELLAGNHLFTCCRDVGYPEICENCAYSTCVEISQALSGKLSSILELLRAN